MALTQAPSSLRKQANWFFYSPVRSPPDTTAYTKQHADTLSNLPNIPPNMLIDTHCHLAHVVKYYPHLIYELQHYPHPFILVDIGCEPSDFTSRKKKFGNIQGVYLAMATHPVYCRQWTLKETESYIRLHADHYHIIGEIGLDLSPQSAPYTYQRDFFELQLAIAHDIQKPVVIHSRNAMDKCIQVLRSIHDRPRGIVHCFSGTLEHAYALKELGFLVSFTANITYPKNEELRRVVRSLDLQDFLLETDAPYMPPVAHRGKANHPFLVESLYHFVAELKGVSVQEIKKAALHNWDCLFLRTR